jgi:hypothetical protein
MAPTVVAELASDIPKRELAVVTHLASLQSTAYSSVHKNIRAHITTCRHAASLLLSLHLRNVVVF